jgi:hypothetical protein
MPPIGRLIGVVAGYVAVRLTNAGFNVGEAELITIFTGVYALAHTVYRVYRSRRDPAGKGVV